MNNGLRLDPGKAMSQLPGHLQPPHSLLLPTSHLAASQVEILPFNLSRGQPRALPGGLSQLCSLAWALSMPHSLSLFKQK